MKSNKWILTGLGVVFITATIGCAPLSTPITYREQTTGLGALGGGAAGALIGSFAGSAVTGGLIGMPLGAIAGYYIGDRLEGEDSSREATLKEKDTELAQLQQENARLKQEQARREEQRAREAAIAAAKPEPAPAPPPVKARPTEAAPAKVVIGFDTDESDPTGDAAKMLNAVIVWLKADPGRQITVDGYTDSVGSDAYNLKLSQRRADSVRDILVKNGVSPDQIDARGMGEGNPVSSNDTATGRENNRRVEVIPSVGGKTAREK
jgi:outer membrane protein OmpA-like peptidoglycan-associated protein